MAKGDRMKLAPLPSRWLPALRGKTKRRRMQFQNYIIPDDHAAPDPLDFYVFAIRGPLGSTNPRTIVMDTGFNPASAKRRGRELLRTPAEALLHAGIDPADVPDVVLTHMHWDHAGGTEYFPKATFHLQATEMAYCTGPCMCHFSRRSRAARRQSRLGSEKAHASTRYRKWTPTNPPEGDSL
jgi:glyoxylase-like metal-dependent hydrolase (beta-lactamase superfamily II)